MKWRCLLLALAAIAVSPLYGGQTDGDAESSLALPYTIERVWFRTDKKKLSGDLTITERALEFTGRKQSLIVPVEAIRIVSYGKMRGDVDTEWTVLAVVESGVAKTYGIRDGRKFGYGARTREIYDAVRLAAKTLSAAQYRAPRGFKPYVEMDHQFTMAIPETWSSDHLLVVEESGLPVRGAIVFSEIPMARERDDPDVRRTQLAAVANGTASAIVLERKGIAPGMSCSGFSARGRERLLAWVGELAPVIKRRPWEFVEPPSFTQATIDDCEGLRVVGRGRNHDDPEVTLDVLAVARNETVFLFALRSVDDELERRTAILDRTVATFRFSAAHGAP